MKKTIICGAILSTLSFGAFAETPSFNYVDLGYVSNLGGSNDFDGYDLKGNFEVSDHFYVNAGYRSINQDFFFFFFDGSVKVLGLGYKTDLNSTTAFYSELDAVKIKANANGFGSASDNGYQIGFGTRSNITNQLELQVGVNYSNVADTNTTLLVGGVYQLNKSAGLYFDIETDFDDSLYSTGVRFSF